MFRQSRRFFSSIVPSKKGHLSSSIIANQKSVPALRHLNPNNKSNNEPIKLSVSHESYQADSTYLINLQLGSFIETVRPSIFVCALDVSDSMNGTCTYQHDPECSKFSRLDLVKHSVNTIIHCLRPVDKLALIGFSNSGQKLLSLEEMNDSGKRKAKSVLQSLRADGSTNLWDGLRISMDELNMLNEINNNKFLLTLTDGEPNINPPRGIHEEFLRKINSNKLLYGVHNFGYGYGLDSSLLSGISTSGGGLFAHIPDHTMCNTVFINFLSNCLATVINKATVRLKSNRGCNFVVLNHPMVDGKYADIGAIQSNQPRNVLLGINVLDPSNFMIELEIDHDNNKTSYVIDKSNLNQLNEIHTHNHDYNVTVLRRAMIDGKFPPIIPDSMFSYEVIKIMLIQTIESIMSSGKLDNSDDKLNQICDIIENAKSDIRDKKILTLLSALRTNIKSTNALEGQIEKALSKNEWYQRWGNHYLRYFIRSHRLEVCSNFKDPSLQHYGGKLFREIKAEVEDIFTQIPIPQPSLSSQQFSGNFTNSFYSASGPCFDGEGIVKMYDGSTKHVKELIKGDKIVDSNDNVSTVVCVLKTLIKGGRTKMCTFNGVKISPWHPIKINDKWEFPTKIQLPVETECDWFYDLVLDDHHIITINGIDIIGLGHGFTHDPVLDHPFFGTNKVIDELKKDTEGWNNGLVTILDYKPIYGEPVLAKETILMDGVSNVAYGVTKLVEGFVL
jgi:hypothetical protein